MRWYRDSEWRLLEVSGKDRVDFFRRLSTNTVPGPQDKPSHNFFLTVNARVLAEFWMFAEPDRLLLVCPAPHLQPAKENIDKFHFGEDLRLNEPEGTLYLVEAPADQLEELCARAVHSFVPDPRFGSGFGWFFAAGDEFATLLEERGQPLGEKEVEAHRVRAGLARYGYDYDDKTLFLEVAGQQDFSESKGCYPGQEIVARVLHRGRLNRSLRGFTSQRSVPSDWVCENEGKEVARVTTSVPVAEGSIGFLQVRREFGEDGQVLTGLGGDGEPVELTVTQRPGELPPGDDDE